MAQNNGNPKQISGWAVGFAVFAGTLMITVGLFDILEGIAAVMGDSVYVVARQSIFAFNLNSWGWWHIVWGVIMMIAGFGVFSGNTWARGLGIFVAAISAIGNFVFIPYYPFWSILIIALDVCIIWGLAHYNPKKLAL